MGQLEEVKADVDRLRCALQQAEIRLCTLQMGTHQLEQCVDTVYQAVTTRHSRIQWLEGCCEQLGHRLRGPDYQMPTTGKKLLERKMNLVTEKKNHIAKRKESKENNSTQKQPPDLHETNDHQRDCALVSSSVTSASTCTLSSPAQQVLSSSLKVQDERGRDSSEQDPIHSQFSNNSGLIVIGQPLGTVASSEMQSNSSEKASLNAPILYNMSSGDEQSSAMTKENSQDLPRQHLPTKHSTRNLVSNQKTEASIAMKRSISDVSSDFSNASCGRKKLNLDQFAVTSEQSDRIDGLENVPSADTKNSTTSNQKSVMRYKSLLQYRSSINRTVDKTPSSTEAILCPFDLSGKCQDTQCPYLHYPA
uniref:Putative zinc-finger domain-containing protein n=1 Tax=Graphocephala atropunctata TaxID=36148 RepID=A0A1B6KDW7_9HEMI